MTHVTIPAQYTSFSTFVYTDCVRVHLNSRKLKLYLLLRDYPAVIIWRKMVGEEERGGERIIPTICIMGKKGNLEYFPKLHICTSPYISQARVILLVQD